MSAVSWAILVLFITSGLANLGLTDQLRIAACAELRRGTWDTFAKLNN